MIFHSVKLENYKSIGKERSEIIIEPNVTSIIGKNESGKSNIITGLSKILFFNYMQQAFQAANVNRMNGQSAEIKYDITLKFTKEEIEDCQISSDSEIIITKTESRATGGLFKFYEKTIRPKTDELNNILGSNPFKFDSQNLAIYRKHFTMLQPDKFLNLVGISEAFGYLEKILPTAQIEQKDIVLSCFSDASSSLDKLKSMLPRVFLCDPTKILKQQYSYEDVKKELASPSSYPDSLLSTFVKLINIDTDVFLSATANGTQPMQSSIRRTIEKCIDSKINDKFRSFYSAETVRLQCEFNAGQLSFNIESNEGELMHMSERSNGLRWYLNLFINLLSNDMPSKNVLYLLDEPGVFLHVNAQKELLTLFEDLASKGNQVVYTTHSPFMITTDNGGLHRIRAVDKNPKGYTSIFKTAYDFNVSNINRDDTLTPIVKAIGMNLSDSFGPAHDKINIICEGSSDYIYMKSIGKLIGENLENINIIPSTGVSKVPSMCNLLFGWGCPFIAVFDYDKDGVKSGKVMSDSELYNLNEHYIYLKEDVTEKDIANATYHNNPFVIENMVGLEYLIEFAKSTGLGEDAVKNKKTLLAKLYCTSLEEGTTSIPPEGRENFNKLFERIQSIGQSKITR